jgi:tRNA-specific 2-thiouridylase
VENSGKKIFVALSGGVDSSVAAALLKKKGYGVTGVFIKGWYPDFLPCNWREDRRDAMRVCAKLNIPFLTLDTGKEYKKSVIDYMIKEYRTGRTPNPDVMCNKHIKFGVFLDFAKKNGVDFIATGHYASRVENRKSKVESRYKLKISRDRDKDQSYFLWTLTQEQLARTLFPVGHLTKKEVRLIARKFNLPTSEKKDSQGICFLGEVNLKDFLKNYIKSPRGLVLNTLGEKIGEHDGVLFLTVGQRHGFKADNRNTNSKPLYIVDRDVMRNTVTVSEEIRVDTENLGIKRIILENPNWISGEPRQGAKYRVRLRYRQEPIMGSYRKEKHLEVIELEKSFFGAANGQSLVVYGKGVSLGGGIIKVS